MWTDTMVKLEKRNCESKYKEISGSVTIGHSSLSVHYVKKKDMGVNCAAPSAPFMQ